MAAECYLCHDFLTQDTRVATLDCGHVCCKHCLEKWFTVRDRESCPVCRHRRPDGRVVLHNLFIRFSDDSTGQCNSGAANDLEDALENARALKNLFEGPRNLQSAGGTDIDTMIKEAGRLNVALKGLSQVRELEDIMTEISEQLGAIKSDMREQMASEARLWERLDKVTEDNEANKRDLEAERAKCDRLLIAERALRADLMLERRRRQDDAEEFRQGVTELTATTRRINNKFFGHQHHGDAISAEVDVPRRTTTGYRLRSPSRPATPPSDLLFPDSRIVIRAPIFDNAEHGSRFARSRSPTAYSISSSLSDRGRPAERSSSSFPHQNSWL